MSGTTAPTARRPWPRPTVPDAIAGVSVGLLLIPQSVAYAQIADMPAVNGLFASALPLIAAALFASSPTLQTGPVALTSLLTLAALQGAGFTAADPQYVALAALLAVLVGAFRLILGLARAGWVAYLISEPVLTGFASAAAVLILTSQLPKALGNSPVVPDGSTMSQALWAAGHPATWEIWAVVLSALTLLIMLGGRQMNRLFPGVAVAVALGLVFSAVVDDPGLTVGEPNPIPEGLPSLTFDLPWSSTGTLVIGAFVIALVGFAEPATIARIFATAETRPWNANRELVAQGVANVVAGISGGFPVGGSFSRTAVNNLAGAQTRWSGGITGLVVLLFLPFAGVLDPLPQAVLGAVVIGSVLGLLSFGRMWTLLRTTPLLGLLAWLTWGSTLLLAPNVHYGVIVGLGATMVAHVVAPLRLDRHSAADGENLDLTHRGLLWFGSHNRLHHQLSEAIEEHPGHRVTLAIPESHARDPRLKGLLAEAAEQARAADGDLVLDHGERS